MSAAVDEPCDAFWARYNRRSEFPLSAATAVLLHTLIAGVCVLLLGWAMHAPAKTGVAIQLITDPGLDEVGDGSPGSGGDNDPPIERDGDPLRGPKATLPNVHHLPKPQELRPSFEFGAGPESVPNAKSDFRELDDTLKNKLLHEPGGKKGEGPAEGRGPGGEKGTGPGGDGKDSTRARTLRWVLRFSTKDGQDYLNQLGALKAELLVPLPPDGKFIMHIPDLANSAKQHAAKDDDLKRLAALVRFSDMREESVRGMCEVLKLDAKAKSFHAFFPRSIEDELLRKEIGYRNRRVEDIEETIFRIHIKDGKAVIEVVDQKVKK